MTDPIRITFCLTNGGIGGTELNAVRTAERLDRDRFDLEVISFADYAPLRDRYEARGIPFRVLPLRSLKGPDLVRRGWALARHLRARRTDLFHAHDSYANILGVPWARAARTPAVLASRRWWTAPHRPGHDGANRLVYRIAHAVLANAPAVADLLMREGLPEEKIRIVPNFLDEESFRPAAGEPALRRELGIPEGARVVGIVAQLRPEKDHAVLLRAAARLASRHPDVHLVLVGEGECRGEIETLRSELGLGDRVHLAGLRHGTGNLHHDFDISVLCSRAEALSNSLLEAMAAGKPVVATNVGGNADAVRDGETGALVPAGDADALAAALDRLLASPELARRLGEAGRRRARREYSAEAALTALDGTYASLLSRDAARSPSSAAVAA